MPTPEPLEQLAMEWPEDDVEPRLPVSAALIRLYLASPFKPLGKQMLLVARPR